MQIHQDQGERVKEVMRELGDLWGLARPLRMAELGRALRLGPTDPATTISNWIENKHKVPGPASAAMEMMMLGALPPDGIGAVIISNKRRPPRPDRAGKPIGHVGG